MFHVLWPGVPITMMKDFSLCSEQWKSSKSVNPLCSYVCSLHSFNINFHIKVEKNVISFCFILGEKNRILGSCTVHISATRSLWIQFHAEGKCRALNPIMWQVLHKTLSTAQFWTLFEHNCKMLMASAWAEEGNATNGMLFIRYLIKIDVIL